MASQGLGWCGAHSVATVRLDFKGAFAHIHTSDVCMAVSFEFLRVPYVRGVKSGVARSQV